MLETPSNLDDRAAQDRLDPSGMMALVMDFPQQCRRASVLADESLRIAPILRNLTNVVVCGMGGSAIAGDILRCLADINGSVPVTVWRDYGLPSWVDGRTLVIAISYSGDTEEVVSSYHVARQNNAAIACIASGGEIGRLAERDRLTWVRVPGGQPPRSATGYLFFPALAIATRFGLFNRPMEEEISETFEVLREMAAELGPDRPTENNSAKQLAAALPGRIPIVCGVGELAAVAAFRWKTQFNENAKVHLFAGSIPEQNHNEIVAWERSSEQSDRWSVVYLRDREQQGKSRIDDRVEITRKIIADAADQHEVWARGKSPLARLLSLVYFGDVVSVYSAYLNGVDPTEIAAIQQLKRKLAGR